jgi:WhiB family transcriptional regulator, redox-sensing transcriptional regulator
VNDDWRAHAACANHPDPEIFFPVSTVRTKPYREETFEARLICANCPANTECFQHAVESGYSYGIWAGIDFADREAVKKIRSAA